jgi:hypothetical protein
MILLPEENCILLYRQKCRPIIRHLPAAVKPSAVAFKKVNVLYPRRGRFDFPA